MPYYIGDVKRDPNSDTYPEGFLLCIMCVVVCIQYRFILCVQLLFHRIVHDFLTERSYCSSNQLITFVSLRCSSGHSAVMSWRMSQNCRTGILETLESNLLTISMLRHNLSKIRNRWSSASIVRPWATALNHAKQNLNYNKTKPQALYHKLCQPMMELSGGSHRRPCAYVLMQLSRLRVICDICSTCGYIRTSMVGIVIAVSSCLVQLQPYLLSSLII